MALAVTVVVAALATLAAWRLGLLRPDGSPPPGTAPQQPPRRGRVTDDVVEEDGVEVDRVEEEAGLDGVGWDERWSDPTTPRVAIVGVDPHRVTPASADLFPSAGGHEATDEADEVNPPPADPPTT